MRVFTSIFPGWLWLLSIAFAATLPAAEPDAAATAPNLSGNYEDGGTLASTTSELAGTEPSLGALLQLAFEGKATALLHEQVARVAIKQSDEACEIELHDREDAVLWRGRWEAGVDFELRGPRVVLHFLHPTSKTEKLFLVLEPIEDRRLLQLTVQRVESTAFGPVVQDRDTCIFPRLL